MIQENTLSELNEIKEIKKTIKREMLYYKTNEYTYNLQNLRNTFGRDIYNGAITLKGADNNQSDL